MTEQQRRVKLAQAILANPARERWSRYERDGNPNRQGTVDLVLDAVELARQVLAEEDVLEGEPEPGEGEGPSTQDLGEPVA